MVNLHLLIQLSKKRSGKAAEEELHVAFVGGPLLFQRLLCFGNSNTVSKSKNFFTFRFYVKSILVEIKPVT